eukprot:COSAG01_NODE_3609_length_5876_cov_70.248572_3_plen_117_part_00
MSSVTFPICSASNFSIFALLLSLQTKATSRSTTRTTTGVNRSHRHPGHGYNVPMYKDFVDVQRRKLHQRPTCHVHRGMLRSIFVHDIARVTHSNDMILVDTGVAVCIVQTQVSFCK